MISFCRLSLLETLERAGLCGAGLCGGGLCGMGGRRWLPLVEHCVAASMAELALRNSGTGVRLRLVGLAFGPCVSFGGDATGPASPLMVAGRLNVKVAISSVARHSEHEAALVKSVGNQTVGTAV
ncbi:hypothetical protein KCU61_g209, partial [Aureobasidium melanogenum]